MLSLSSFAVLSLSLVFSGSMAHVTKGRPGKGIIGYGIDMYDPPCAYGCKGAVKAWSLDCGDFGTGGHSHDGTMAAPTPECYANNEPFLKTLAFCISVHCKGVAMSKIERFWETDLVGHQTVQPSPKISYQQALVSVTTPPTTVVDGKEMLETVSLVDDTVWLANFNGNEGFEVQERLHSRTG